MHYIYILKEKQLSESVSFIKVSLATLLSFKVSDVFEARLGVYCHEFARTSRPCTCKCVVLRNY